MKRILGVRKKKSLCQPEVDVVAYFIECDDDSYANADMTPDASGKTTGDVNDR